MDRIAKFVPPAKSVTLSMRNTAVMMKKQNLRRERGREGERERGRESQGGNERTRESVKYK
jgi:hypothetical protein